MEDQLQRLETVRQLLRLNTEADKELQNIVNLAADISETPVALLTILDDENQWFKARKGTDITSTPRSISFCTHAIDQEEVMVIPDMLQDKRFTNNPLVTNDPHIRFYAGAPLTTSDGIKVGTLCILDQKPRLLTAKQQKILELLSQQAINKLELLLTIKNLNETLAEAEYQKKILHEKSIRLRAFFEGFNSCYILVDKEFKVLDFNNTAAVHLKKLTGEDLWVGKHLSDIIPADQHQAVLRGISLAMEGRPGKEELLVQYDAELIWWEMHFCPAKDTNGNIIGVSFNSIDITDSKKQQQAILIQNSSLRQIAYIQSHEFRKPVTTILGLMHLIKESKDDHPAIIEYLQYMEQAVGELDEKIKISVDFTAIIPVSGATKT